MSILIASMFYSIVTIALNYLVHIASHTPVPETLFQLCLVFVVYTFVFNVALSRNKGTYVG